MARKTVTKTTSIVPALSVTLNKKALVKQLSYCSVIQLRNVIKVYGLNKIDINIEDVFNIDALRERVYDALVKKGVYSIKDLYDLVPEED